MVSCMRWLVRATEIPDCGYRVQSIALQPDRPPIDLLGFQGEGPAVGPVVIGDPFEIDIIVAICVQENCASTRATSSMYCS